MLTIVPADEATASRCRQAAGQSGSCLSMTENGEWKGFCLYTEADDRLTVHTLETDDELLAEGLLRAALNIARNRELPIAVCEDTRFPELLRRLGFVESADGACVDTVAFFRPCCGCRKEQGE